MGENGPSTMPHASGASRPEYGGLCRFHLRLFPLVLPGGYIWYMFYVGSRTPGVVPGVPYTALTATSRQFESRSWIKENEKPGKSKHVCIPLREKTFYSDTACCGFVMPNPKWKGKTDGENFHYMMFFSGASMEGDELVRTLGVARTNDLCATDDYDKTEGNFWVVDQNPIVPPTHDIENSSVFFEEETGTYYLFTNHIDPSNSHTDAIWVYWTKDCDNWPEENRAVVLDVSNTIGVKGAIGMPSVLRIDSNTLLMTYDGCVGCDTSHLHRDICFAKIQLPLQIDS